MISKAAGAIAFAAVIAFAAPAEAQAVKLLGQYRDWSAYTATEATGPVCFALTRSTNVDPRPDGFTEAYLYLTHRPSEGVRNELNIVAGFTFAQDQPATATVDGQSFELFTEKDAAWLLNPSENNNLAGAMRAGSNVVVEGTSEAGIRITETFSLSGATAASKAVESSCAS